MLSDRHLVRLLHDELIQVIHLASLLSPLEVICLSSWVDHAILAWWHVPAVQHSVLLGSSCSTGPLLHGDASHLLLLLYDVCGVWHLWLWLTLTLVVLARDDTAMRIYHLVVLHATWLVGEASLLLVSLQMKRLLLRACGRKIFQLIK